MGLSAKKKKDKKKDFQKPQAKVGKTKPKATNFTDTSFKAKSIVVNKQSISVAAPTASAQFAHHVSLLRNRSDTQRADSLAFITSTISSVPRGGSLPEPVAVLLPKILPLCLDGSSAVRQQLLKLLRALTAQTRDVHAHTENVLLYVHAAMSHLSANIRGFSVDLLDWLLDFAGTETVGCAGGWIKTLACFITLLGWKSQEPIPDAARKQRGWSSVQQAGTKSGTEARTTARQLVVFARFLEMGFRRQTIAMADGAGLREFPLWSVQQHLLPLSANAYAHLDLFGRARDAEAEMLEDREDRQRVFKQNYVGSVEAGVDVLVKEGGELGRSAAVVKKAIHDGLRDIDSEDA